MERLNKFKEAIKGVYSSVEKLRLSFPDRPFTPDGKLVGDIGEALAVLIFGIHLDKKNRKGWDGYWINSSGKKYDVQVRATQKDGTYLKEPPYDGTFLVFKISSDGGYKTIYNGNIMRVWKSIKNQQSKEKTISLKTLEGLNKKSDPKRINI